MAGRRMSKRRIIRRSCEFGCMKERPRQERVVARKARTADGHFRRIPRPEFRLGAAL
jgi:hypothetical protein